MGLLEKGKVCVTGAAGFIGSWLVKLLLAKGYIVHATVRDPCDAEKNDHLWKLDHADENLKVFKAELLDYESLLNAFEGCIGVFHLAAPVPSSFFTDPEKELVEPCVKGTLNVLKACSEVKVKRLVVMSSFAAMVKNPAWPIGQPMDETCWSDTDYCRRTETWYFVAKTEAERLAIDYAEKYELDVVTICPPVVYGPVLQRTLNLSSLILIQMLNGTLCIEDMERVMVDVRDLAEAHILLFEKPEAKGRYVCSSHEFQVQEMVEKLKRIYPDYVYIDPKKQKKEQPTSDLSQLYYMEETELERRVNSEKLLKLGWRNFRPLDETLVDSIDSYKLSGFL